MEITAEHDCFIIRRARKKHLTIEERFESYSGDYQYKELDTGKPVGNEALA